MWCPSVTKPAGASASTSLRQSSTSHSALQARTGSGDGFRRARSGPACRESRPSAAIQIPPDRGWRGTPSRCPAGAGARDPLRKARGAQRPVVRLDDRLGSHHAVGSAVPCNSSAGAGRNARPSAEMIRKTTTHTKATPPRCYAQVVGEVNTDHAHQGARRGYHGHRRQRTHHERVPRGRSEARSRQHVGSMDAAAGGPPAASRSTDLLIRPRLARQRARREIVRNSCRRVLTAMYRHS